MKLMLSLLISLLAVNSYAADVTVTPCVKDSKILKVQIEGDSALNIFRALAARLKMTPAQLSNIVTAGMNCEGRQFSSNGDVLVAGCSYVIKGSKSIPYPQVDPAFSREEVIVCD